jgi:hypothetical protein
MASCAALFAMLIALLFGGTSGATAPTTGTAPASQTASASDTSAK